jgi:AraC family L-rhamnose operon transcriptional activator RhaR
MTGPTPAPRFARLPWNRHLDAAHRIQAIYQPRHDHYPPHDHDFIEVVLVVGGTALHRTPAGDRPIGRGDAFLLRPGAWHGYERCRSLAIYNCCFAVTTLGRELDWTRDDPALHRLLWTLPLTPSNHGMVALALDNDSVEEASFLLDRLCRLHGRDDVAYRADSIGILCQILGVLARSLPVDTDTPRGPDRLKPIHAARKLIDGNLSHDWTLQELANRTGLAPSSLVRRFHAIAGLPPMAYLTKCRLDAAARLLTDTREPIGVIGNRVGWPDANYFTRRFKKHFGVTPTEYRASYGGRPRDERT